MFVSFKKIKSFSSNAGRGFVVLMGMMGSAFGVVFPGPTPGVPVTQNNGSVHTLSNDTISVSCELQNGMLYVRSVQNKLTNKTFTQAVPSPVFKIKTSGVGLLNDWVLTSSPTFTAAEVDSNSSSTGKHFPGKILKATFSSATGGVTVNWFAELRNDSGYIRSVVDFQGTGAGGSFTEVEMLCDLQIDANGASKVGTQSGAVLKSGGMYFGVEMPFYWSDLSNNRIRGGVTTSLALGADKKYSFAAVMGVYPENQLRRSFLHYNDRERARSYKPLLNYNCWFDLERGVSSDSMIGRINSIHDQMTTQRGINLDSYVIDDGYDDYSASTGGFWKFNATKFPNGFSSVANRLSQINSNLGIWISPGGGYEGVPERAAYAKSEFGLSSFSWDLSIPEYGAWWKTRHVNHVNNDKAVYFKWDQLGSSASGHFMKLIDTARDLRKINPNIFVNTTVGTWQSPFWLNQIDCTWRGGDDMGFEGQGDERERWLNYLDRVSWDRMNEIEHVYPLNALMNHGIVFANGHPFAANAYNNGTKNINNEVRSFFGGGYALQELYLTPSLLQPSQWNAIAAGTAWAKSKKDILVDSHFIGASPSTGQVYGFAAWQNNRAVLTLRNPSNTVKTFVLDVQSAFELPASAARAYKLQSPYLDQRVQSAMALAGRGTSIELQPFEVLVFDAEVDTTTLYADLRASSTSGTAPHTVVFDVSQSLPQSVTKTYELDADSDGVVDLRGSGLNMFTYSVPGTYTATLLVKDALGNSSRVTKEIIVTASNLPPQLVGSVVPVVSVSTSSIASNGTNTNQIIDGSGLSSPLNFANRLDVTHLSGLNLSKQFLSNNVHDQTFTFHFNNETINEILIWNYSQSDARGLDGISKVEIDTGSGFVDQKLSMSLLPASAVAYKAQSLKILNPAKGTKSIRITVTQASTGPTETAGGFDEVAFAKDGRIYISDLNWNSSSVGWSGNGGVKKDTAYSGSNLSVDGYEYVKGLGTHAQSEIIYQLDGKYTTFSSVLGVDDLIPITNPDGRVSFKVFADNTLKYDSGTITPASIAKTCSVDVNNVQTLCLVVEQGDNIYSDHADWANAYLIPKLPQSSFEIWSTAFAIAPNHLGNDDGDKYSNLEEFAFGLNPAQPDTAYKATSLLAGDQDYMVFRFPVVTEGVNCTVQYSTNLRDWLPHNAPLEKVGNFYQTLVPKKAAGSTKPAQFMRLSLKVM